MTGAWGAASTCDGNGSFENVGSSTVKSIRSALLGLSSVLATLCPGVSSVHAGPDPMLAQATITGSVPDSVAAGMGYPPLNYSPEQADGSPQRGAPARGVTPGWSGAHPRPRAANPVNPYVSPGAEPPVLPPTAPPAGGYAPSGGAHGYGAPVPGGSVQAPGWAGRPPQGGYGGWTGERPGGPAFGPGGPATYGAP